MITIRCSICDPNYYIFGNGVEWWISHDESLGRVWLERLLY